MRGRVPFVAIGFTALGVVLGFVLGGIGPRLEVEEREEEIARLERELEEADTGGWRSPVPGLDRILRAPEGERGPRPLPADDEVDRSPTPEGSTEPPEVAAAGDGGVPEARPRWRDRWAEDTPEDRLSAFRRAASIQRVRQMQSRAALVQQADLTEDEQAEVDEALTEMNEELYGHGEELLMLAMSDAPPDARDLLGITHDVTGIMHRAQLRLERILGPDRVGRVEPSALEIWNHVDLAQLEPAARSATRNAP